MSVLRNLESKLAGLVEGTFSRAFKSEVRPVEIARKLAKEMDEHKVQSLSRVYAPNEYAVWLSPEDRKQFESYEDELASELAGYLLEHARRERIALATSPKLEFRTDDALRLGEFGIQARLVRPPAREHEPASQGDQGHTMVYSASERLSEPLREPDPRRGQARLRVDGGRSELVGSRGAVLGRSRDADITLDDPNVSRRHAEVRPSGGSWIVNDLGSTNRIKVNSPPVRRIVDRQRSRIDQRHQGQRPPRARPAVAQAGRRDRARDLAGDLRAGVADGARSDRRGTQVRFSGRAVSVPALGRALGAQGPATRHRGGVRGSERGL